MASVNNIGKFREERKWSRPKLAKLMGTSPQQVERLEKSQRKLSLDWIDRAADALEVTPAALITEGATIEDGAQISPSAAELPSEAALAVVLDVILDGTASIELPNSARRPAASILRLCLQLLQENPAIDANDDAIKAVARALVVRLPDPMLEP